MRTNLIILGVFAAVSLLAAAEVRSQVADSGQDVFSITATGEAKGSPDVMRIELVSEATAGNASDAFRQCKEKADAAAKAIDAMQIPGSQLTRTMYEFSSPATDPISSVRPLAGPAGTRVSQVLRVIVKIDGKSKPENLAETVSRVFDAANKSGVGMKQGGRREQILGEGTPAVTYVLQDVRPLAKLAIADAFQKAEEIKGSLVASGASPGTLVGIDFRQMEEMMTSRRASLDSDGLDRKAAVSSSPEAVTVTRSLVFRYRVERPKGQ